MTLSGPAHEEAIVVTQHRTRRDRTARHRLVIALLSGVVTLGCDDRELAPISLEPMLTIGATEGDGTLATWPRVSARHPGGFRVVIPQPGSVPSTPLVYDDEGRYLGRLGVEEDGLDDFVEPLFTRIGPGDSLWIFDGARRALVFSPAREHVRTIALPFAPWDAVVMAGGRIAVTPATFGAPLPWLLIDADGATIRSVGEPDTAVPSPRRIIAGRDGTVWTLAMTHRWQVEHWGPGGELLHRFTEAPAWFTPHDELQAPTPERPPQPAVQDGWVDREGRLWIVGKVADATWQEGIGTPVDGASPIVDADRAHDTIVEVHDPVSGVVLAEARFDAAYPFMAEPGVLMRVRTTEEGWHQAELARVMVDASRLPGGTP